MGNSNSGGLALNEKDQGRANGKKNWFRVDSLMLTRGDVEAILDDENQKAGTYVLYEDPEREKTYLAVKMSSGHIVHHSIQKINDLYYFNDFPFPYLESIILYYTKHKFNGTRFTQQAFVTPYATAQRNKKGAKPIRAPDTLKGEDQQAPGTWSYGQYRKSGHNETEDVAKKDSKKNENLLVN